MVINFLLALTDLCSFPVQPTPVGATLSRLKYPVPSQFAALLLYLTFI